MGGHGRTVSGRVHPDRPTARRFLLAGADLSALAVQLADPWHRGDLFRPRTGFASAHRRLDTSGESAFSDPLALDSDRGRLSAAGCDDHNGDGFRTEGISLAR